MTFEELRDAEKKKLDAKQANQPLQSNVAKGKLPVAEPAEKIGPHKFDPHIVVPTDNDKVPSGAERIGPGVRGIGPISPQPDNSKAGLAPAASDSKQAAVEKQSADVKAISVSPEGAKK